MSNDVFGELTLFTFVEIPRVQLGEGVEMRDHTRTKRVRLATVGCKRSECEANVAEFKRLNSRIAGQIFAEFSFRECL